jgi:hypothetical protein
MEQNYNNHTRWHPPFHFVMAPILLMHLIWSAKLAYGNPSWPMIEGFLLAIGIFLAGFLTRVSALKAQDRTIRLEEKLRYREVLSPELQKRAEALTTAQVVALRFASDAELPGLIEKTLAGQFANSKAIKQAIQHWRPDFDRV